MRGTTELHPDFKDLLEDLVNASVRFVVLGGYAVGHHAKSRATEDLDLLVCREGDNLERAASTLASFGAPRPVVDDLRSLLPNEIVYLGVPPAHIGIMCRADGVATEEVLAHGVVVQVGPLSIRGSRAQTSSRTSERPGDRKIWPTSPCSS